MITMVLDGEGVDPRWARVVVIFNATPWTLTQTVDGLRGSPLQPHPIQAASADPAAREAGFDQASGTFTVPGRTVGVFVV